MVIERLRETLSVCKVKDYSLVDLDAAFCFTGRTDAEKSLVCETARVPANAIAREDGWRAFRVRGPLDLSLIGVLSRMLTVLAERGIGVFVLSTYDTDYVLTREESFERALEALADAGYDIA